MQGSIEETEEECVDVTGGDAGAGRSARSSEDGSEELSFVGRDGTSGVARGNRDKGKPMGGNTSSFFTSAWDVADFSSENPSSGIWTFSRLCAIQSISRGVGELEAFRRPRQRTGTARSLFLVAMMRRRASACLVIYGAGNEYEGRRELKGSRRRDNEERCR